MKKFLFTLAALLMAGSAFAEDYLYVADFEVAKDKLGGEIEIPVAAHFDARVSAIDFTVHLPEGLTVAEFWEGEDATIDYYTNTGRARTVTAAYASNDNLHYIVITSATTQGYYQVDGVWTSYGAVKWEPGDYSEMLVLLVEVAEDFKGGEVMVHTEPSSGQDPRGNTCPKGQVNEHTNMITVEGAQVEPQDLAGEIVIGDVNENGQVAISYTGDEDVTITVTVGETTLEVVDGMVQLPEYGEYTINVTVAAEGYNDLTATKDVAWIEPEPEVTDSPVINYDPETLTATAEGNGTVILYVNSVEVENPYTFEQTDEDVTYVLTATAQEEGKLVSQPTVLTIVVPAKEVEPEVTPNPTINYDPETMTLTVDGEGDVHVYVDGVEVTLPYTFEQGDEDMTYVVTATAQGEGKLVSETVEQTIVVPGKGEQPVDPHMTGYWVVVLDKDGNEVWYELTQAPNGDYTTAVSLEYDQFGAFDWDPSKSDAENDALRPDVNFYYVVNGVVYSADEVKEANLGDAMQNPLAAEAEGNYTVKVGYSYTLGIFVDPTNGDLYAYVARGGYTGVDELVNGKAVAGVRYFNLAGQEMQEANGMTIVVTTYTDGTTSAVKVMK